jgi:hypothetical protein
MLDVLISGPWFYLRTATATKSVMLQNRRTPLTYKEREDGTADLMRYD